VSKEILWVTFRSVEVVSLVLIESSCELVAVDDPENSLVDIKVHSNIEIFPGVILGLIIWEWKFVSFQENALWDSGVINLAFENNDCVVFEVVVDSAFSGSEVLIWVFNHWLNKICVENEAL
jgi:hypothetical protein